MATNDGFVFTGGCIRGGKPQCKLTCPLGVDSRNYLKRLKTGNFDSAYCEYAKQVVFPDIVWRLCRGYCLSECPDSIPILDIEKACVEYAENKEPVTYNINKQDKRVAIIGAGLSGLACAARLAARSYKVTVYEKKGEIGGSLSEVIDKEIYLKEFDHQLDYSQFELKLNTEVTSLSDISCDAVYICTGSGGTDFGISSASEEEIAAYNIGIIVGGRLTGVTHIEALSHGLSAAVDIENYFKLGCFLGNKKVIIKENILSDEALKNGNKTAVTRDKQELIDAAAKCTNCACSICQDSCEFLKKYKSFPQRIERDCTFVSKPIQPFFMQNTHKRKIYSCSVCGHCDAICPGKIETKNLMLDLKRKQYEYGYYPPALHEYYVRDMDSALSEAFLSLKPDNCEKADYVFFPGCGINASEPEITQKVVDYMSATVKNTAVMLGCCGIPQLWAGNIDAFNEVLNKLKTEWENLGKPTFVVACTSCLETFLKYTDFPCVSIYELMLEHGIPAKANSLEGEWAVFDPCSSRGYTDVQKSIRKIAEYLGANLTEIKDSGDRARCCGNGGHIYPANPELFHNSVSASAQCSEAPYICYCINCRDIFLNAEKRCVHILESALDITPKTKSPHLSEKHWNRVALKNKLIGNEKEVKPDSIDLSISEELLNKMDQALISEDDVRQTIEYCEKNNARVQNIKTGVITGYCKIGIITYWVQYIVDGNKYELKNAYSHRLVIKEDKV